MLLLALALAKRVSDFHALSVHPSCAQLFPGDVSMFLKPNPVLMPKVVGSCSIDLMAFAASPGEQRSHALCPVRAVRTYWTGRIVSGGLISCSFPGLILMRGDLSQSSAYPTGWWSQLLWPIRVRVCSHLWACECTRLWVWPHIGPYSGESLFRTSVLQRVGLRLSLLSVSIRWTSAPCVARAVLLS